MYLKIFIILILVNISKNSFAQLPSFDQYKVQLFSGHRAKLIIKGNPLAETTKPRFRIPMMTRPISDNGMEPED
jgi:hypothetical protein